MTDKKDEYDVPLANLSKNQVVGLAAKWRHELRSLKATARAAQDGMADGDFVVRNCGEAWIEITPSGTHLVCSWYAEKPQRLKRILGHGKTDDEAWADAAKFVRQQRAS